MLLLNTLAPTSPLYSSLVNPSAEVPRLPKPLVKLAVSPLTPAAASIRAILVSIVAAPRRFISSASRALSSSISSGVYAFAITIFT